MMMFCYVKYANWKYAAKMSYKQGFFTTITSWLVILEILGHTYTMEKKANSAFMKPMNVDAELAAVIGAGPMPRSEVVKKLWVYIKEHNLQDPANKRNINADEKLQKVFEGKTVVNMFEMTKLVSKHLS